MCYISVCIIFCYLPSPNGIYLFEANLAWCSLFALTVPLNTNQPVCVKELYYMCPLMWFHYIECAVRSFHGELCQTKLAWHTQRVLQSLCESDHEWTVFRLFARWCETDEDKCSYFAQNSGWMCAGWMLLLA